MIQWSSFAIVAIASIAFTLVIVSGFSIGVRLLTNAQNHSKRVEAGNQKAASREALFRMGAYMLFALCALALAYGIWLVVPGFHK